MADDQAAFDRYWLAMNTVKEILFLYREIIECAGITSIKAVPIDFDESLLIDCEPADYGIDKDTANLLHCGSAIWAICGIYQCRESGGIDAEELSKIPHIRNVREMLDSGRLAHLPDLEDAVRRGLQSEKKLNEVHGQLYNKYILGYFEKLSKSVLRDPV